VDGFAPDVVLLDLGLPGMDGYEVARRIKRDHRSMRVVALSGYGQARDKALSAAAGFDAHAVKPVDMAALDQLLGR
jgi:CheY-like chemotaxis protein